MSELLKVAGLRAGYEGIPVVFGIDLEVHQAEVVALLGANGAGKTTTLRALSGMVRPMAGSVSFAGHEIAGWDAARIARTGLLHVPEGRGVFRSLAVDETLRLAATLAGLKGGDAAARLDEAYTTFPRLDERRGQVAGSLSGGEQQMLAIARGIIAQPPLLMIDEMSQGLAPTIVDQLMHIVAGFPARGVSVLLVEQFVGRALEVASRAYVLEKGAVSFAGPARTLARDEEFVRGSYLGAADVVPGAADGDDAPRRQGEQVSVTLPSALLRGLDARARKEGITPEELVQQLVNASVENGSASRRRAARPAAKKTAAKKTAAKKTAAKKTVKRSRGSR